jgi:lysozyme family protein
MENGNDQPLFRGSAPARLRQTMTDLIALAKANAARWPAAKLTRAAEFIPTAKRLVAGKARFQMMAARTGVPWFVIAVIKQRESGNDPNWLGNIANGQAWAKTTTIVPIGRGPFTSWEEAARDALVNCAPFASRNRDWSAGGTLTLLETYNGLGYANKGLPSPYIWSGTDQYRAGKYVRDHVFDSAVVDEQLGCAGLILAMQALDSSIQFGVLSSGGAVVAATRQPVIAPHPASVPSIANPAPGSIAAKVSGWFSSVFSKAA